MKDYEERDHVGRTRELLLHPYPWKYLIPDIGIDSGHEQIPQSRFGFRDSPPYKVQEVDALVLYSETYETVAQSIPKDHFGHKDPPEHVVSASSDDGDLFVDGLSIERVPVGSHNISLSGVQRDVDDQIVVIAGGPNRSDLVDHVVEVGRLSEFQRDRPNLRIEDRIERLELWLCSREVAIACDKKPRMSEYIYVRTIKNTKARRLGLP
jgi:hypothetical protein